MQLQYTLTHRITLYNTTTITKITFTKQKAIYQHNIATPAVNFFRAYLPSKNGVFRAYLVAYDNVHGKFW